MLATSHWASRLSQIIMASSGSEDCFFIKLPAARLIESKRKSFEAKVKPQRKFPARAFVKSTKKLTWISPKVKST
jgi:hypothetical protein